MKKREIFNLSYLVFTVFLIFVLFSIPVFSQTEKNSEAYKDNDTITLIVPFSPGGGYDTLARLIQPFFQDEIRELSGAKVNLIVENVTGAGGVIGYSTMFRAKPDGKTIGMVGLQGAPFQQMGTDEFDLREFTHIGQANIETAGLMVSAESDLNDMQDLIDRSKQMPILFATSGVGAAEHIRTILAQAILAENGIELNADFVHYDGTGEAMIAILKGDAEAMISSAGTPFDLVNDGELKVISIFDPIREQRYPDTKAITEENIPGGDQIADQIFGNIRIIVAPPDTPEPIALILREALVKTLNKPEVQEMARNMKVALQHASAEEVAGKVDRLLSLVDRYSDIIMPLYTK